LDVQEKRLSTSIPDLVLAAFGLVANQVGRQIESFGNDNWVVRHRTGTLCILRRNAQHESLERLRFQVNLQRHLLARGVPTAAILEANDGSVLVVDDEGVTWMLFAHVHGTAYAFDNPKQTVEAAQWLARFHDVCASFAAEPPEAPGQVPIRACWANASQNLSGLEAMFQGSRFKDELAYVRAYWQSLLQDWPLERVDALPSGLMHGDYHGRNLVFVGERLAGLFDFDDVSRGPLIWDVANAALKFGRTGRGSLTFRPHAFRLFLEAYASLRPLSRDEREILPTMVVLSNPPYAPYYRYRAARHLDVEARFLREVASMQKLTREMVRIAFLLDPD